jgi:hypothetical protein
MLCGAESFVDFEDFGKAKGAMAAQFSIASQQDSLPRYLWADMDVSVSKCECPSSFGSIFLDDMTRQFVRLPVVLILHTVSDRRQA